MNFDLNKVLKNSIWNVSGVIFYYFCQWLINILVVRLSGSYEEAGILSISLTISTIFGTISSFSVRPFQVADIDNRFSNSEYLTFRYITSGAALVSIFIYLAVVRYTLYTSLAAICCLLIKIVEYVCDATEGIFQKQWRLDLACKSYIFRGISYVMVFFVVELVTKNLVIALFLSFLAEFICMLIFNLKKCYRLNEIKIEFKNKHLISLFKSTLPLFFHGVLVSLIGNIPRLYAKEICGEEALGCYSSIAAIAYVIQLATYVAFSPLIPLLSESFKKKTKKIYILIMEVALIILTLGFLVILGINFLGEFIYKLLFGESILQYFYLAVPSMIASVLFAYALFMTDLFVVINRNNTKVILETFCVILYIIITPYFLNTYGLQGINWVMMVVYVIFILAGYSVVFYSIKKNMKPFHSDI